MLFAGGIHGLDLETGETAETLEEQVALMFRHVASVVEAAGGTTSDIVKMTVWLRDRTLRPVVDTHWLEMFPDPSDRPPSHTMRGNLDWQHARAVRFCGSPWSIGGMKRAPLSAPSR